MRKIIIVSLISVVCIALLFAFFKTSSVEEKKLEIGNNMETEKDIELESSDEVTIVPTMKDKIKLDSLWCCTFQLVWNDMKNNIVEKDIVFNPQEKMAENLNKEEFTENMISEDYYYKKCGLKTVELKEEIEKGILEKFNQKSVILDDFDWSEDELDSGNDENARYFLYTMLYRKFEFLKEFDKLKSGKFGKYYDNINYFGLDSSTDDEVGDQISVLYYNSTDDFAISINTKNQDEVIFVKNPKGNNFEEIYNSMNKKVNSYYGNRHFEDIDEFKAPVLKFREKKEYEELEGKVFEVGNPLKGNAIIKKAIQSIELSLDEKGGEIKSEAALDVLIESAMVMEEETIEPRYFYLDDTFAIFLREYGKEKPYFAGIIDDITKFQ